MPVLRGDVERLIGRGLDSLDDLEEAVIAADRLDRDARRATLERMAARAVRDEDLSDPGLIAACAAGDRTATYYKMPVSQAVLNYHPESADPALGNKQWTPVDSTTVKDTSTLDKLKKIPFGVLTMYGGDHMALLIHGVVYEIHWDEESTSLDLYEVKELEDYGWHTGAVVVPPDEFAKAFGNK